MPTQSSVKKRKRTREFIYHFYVKRRCGEWQAECKELRDIVIFSEQCDIQGLKNAIQNGLSNYLGKIKKRKTALEFEDIHS